jgi:hypothetical protein
VNTGSGAMVTTTSDTACLSTSNAVAAGAEAAHE